MKLARTALDRHRVTPMSAAENQCRIRKATEADMSGIAKVLVDIWSSTFRGLLPDDFLDGMSHARQEQRHRRTFARPETTYHVVVDVFRTDEPLAVSARSA
jgi:hypothetical protein